MAGRTVSAIVVALACQGAVATIAQADGLPVLGLASAAHGVSTRDGMRRYIARPRRHETIVTATSATGRTLGRSVLRGRFDVPVVAYDGSAAGLSADGRTLVLIRPRVVFPQRWTELAIVATRALRPRWFERLRGDFSFDAISPNGAWVYLIQYTSRLDPTRYRVRALSTRTGRLLVRDIVDPHNRSEAMRGSPITRVSSPNGRWAYTLYDGNGHPFVHALDTPSLKARCIDVAAFPANSDTWQARLRLAGQRLNVVLGSQTLSEINTASLSLLASARTSRPIKAKAATAPRNASTPPESATIGVVSGIVAALVLLAGVILAIRCRFGPLLGRTQPR